MDQVGAFVRRVARRFGTQALVEAGVRCLCVGLGAAALLVLAERLVSLGVDVALLAVACVLASCVAGVSLGLARWPRLEVAALRADARFGLAERLSTALAVREGPMGHLVHADAARRAGAIDLRTRLPVCAPRLWRVLPLVAVGVALAFFVPPIDLLGWDAARRARATARAAVRGVTDAARVDLGKVAGAARREGLDRPAEALHRIDRTLAELAASASAADAAAEAARRAFGELERARSAGDAAERAATEREERERLQRESDILQSAHRVLERWRRGLDAGARGALPPGANVAPKKKNDGAGGAKAEDLVRSHEPLPVPPDTARVEGRILAARTAAAAAMRRETIPWRYRAAVRRYFSPDEDSPRAGQ